MVFVNHPLKEPPMLPGCVLQIPHLISELVNSAEASTVLAFDLNLNTEPRWSRSAFGPSPFIEGGVGSHSVPAAHLIPVEERAACRIVVDGPIPVRRPQSMLTGHDMLDDTESIANASRRAA